MKSLHRRFRSKNARDKWGFDLNSSKRLLIGMMFIALPILILTATVFRSDSTRKLSSATPVPLSQPKVASGNSNPLFMPAGFYVPYNWNMMKEAESLRAQNRSADAAIVEKVARKGNTSWITGTQYDFSNLQMVLYGGGKEKGATNTKKMPVAALYNIPHRDCGYYSGGGVEATAYRKWIDNISGVIGTSRIGIILEPDAIHVTKCLTSSQKTERWSLIRYADQTLKSHNPNAVVYIAAPAGVWGIDEHVANLRASGIELVRGIALNTSGFERTEDAIAVGDAFRRKLGLDIHYVIDTSRNGNGPNVSPDNREAEWCNPPGRAYGAVATTNTGNARVDAFLWIKDGQLDGDCWKSQHFDHVYDFVLQMAHNTWG